MFKTRKYPKPKEKTYHHGDLRQSLLRAALELLEQDDAAALTLREVARRAGVSHTAPYRHFADKQSLLMAVAEEGFNALRADMEARMCDHSDPLRRLQESGIAYVLFAVSHPAHYRIMFGRAFAAKEISAALHNAGGAAFLVLLHTIRQGHEANMLRAGDPFDQAIAAWSAVHGLAMLFINGQLQSCGVDSANMELLATKIANILQVGLKLGSAVK